MLILDDYNRVILEENSTKELPTYINASYIDVSAVTNTDVSAVINNDVSAVTNTDVSIFINIEFKVFCLPKTDCFT
jgi:protein tyrosine phosphatase